MSKLSANSEDAMSVISAQGRGWAAKAGIGACLLLAFNSCGLDKVEVPAFDGPSEFALSLRLTASPDLLTADGLSTSSIQAQVRGPNGEPVANRNIFFTITDEAGHPADIGQLRSGSRLGVGTGVNENTNSQGIAQAIYEAPVRTDAQANQTLLIVARPVGDDANGEVYRTVRIELRQAEGRLFPQVPGNLAPKCNFAIETPQGLFTNRSILFQNTSSDTDGTIARYEWFFGDGTRGDSPDQNHVYHLPGVYTVTLVVTDDDGGQSACAVNLTIQ
jgi:PKD domain